MHGAAGDGQGPPVTDRAAGRTGSAPTALTIIVALVLVLVGLLATYGPLLTDTIGVVAFIGAGVLLLLGMMFRRI